MLSRKRHSPSLVPTHPSPSLRLCGLFCFYLYRFQTFYFKHSLSLSLSQLRKKNDPHEENIEVTICIINQQTLTYGRKILLLHSFVNTQNSLKEFAWSLFYLNLIICTFKGWIASSKFHFSCCIALYTGYFIEYASKKNQSSHFSRPLPISAIWEFDLLCSSVWHGNVADVLASWYLIGKKWR